MAAQMIGPVQGDQLISVQKNSEISLLSEVSALNSLSKDFLSRYAELLQPLATYRFWVGKSKKKRTFKSPQKSSWQKKGLLKVLKKVNVITQASDSRKVTQKSPQKSKLAQKSPQKISQKRIFTQKSTLKSKITQKINSKILLKKEIN